MVDLFLVKLDLGEFDVMADVGVVGDEVVEGDKFGKVKVRDRPSCVAEDVGGVADEVEQGTGMSEISENP